MQPTLTLTCSPAQGPWHRCLRETRTSNNTQQNTTWLPRLKLAQWEKDVFPRKQNSKSRVVLHNKKNKQGLFPMVFVALAAKVLSFHLLVANSELANQWKNRLSWSLVVSDVKKFDRFQITSVIKMKNDCVWCLSSIWCLYSVYMWCLSDAY